MRRLYLDQETQEWRQVQVLAYRRTPLGLLVLNPDCKCKQSVNTFVYTEVEEPPSVPRLQKVARFRLQYLDSRVAWHLRSEEAQMGFGCG